MEKTGEQPSFEIKPTIEQKPFETPAVQSFFGKWCEINDGIRPEFVDRKSWEDRGGIGTVLEERPDGKKALFIPKDLQLWEMVGVMEAVDKDTFAEDPERQIAKKEELVHLGQMFEHAGVYVAQRIDSIDQGKPIAKDLAVTFYDYGQSLVTGKKPEHEATIEELSELSIPADELEDVDEWLAGDRFYAAKKKHLDQVLIANPEERDRFFEEARRDTLKRFFRVSKIAFERQSKTDTAVTDTATEVKPEAVGQELKPDTREIAPADTSVLKPWELETPLHTGFINKANTNMKRAIEAPRREMEGAIFRRGMELLQRNMPIDKLPDNIRESITFWENGDKTLREALDIDRLKSVLARVKQEGNVSELARIEEHMAHEIQMAVSNYPRMELANSPSEMISAQEINCVGASLLGGALLSELGISYLVASVPEHSILFLVTNSGEVEYLDMLNPQDNHKLTDEDVSGSNNSQVTVEDIVNFQENSKQKSFNFELLSEEYKVILEEAGEQSTRITVYEPGLGQKVQVLNNTAKTLVLGGFADEAVEASRSVLGLDLGNPDLYKDFAVILSLAGRSEEAIEVYRQAIAMNPNNNILYYLLGNRFTSLHRSEEAIEVYRQAIILNPDDSANTLVYFGLGENLAVIGENEEAIEYLEKFIKLADPKEEKNRLEYARSTIEDLRL